MKKNICLLFLMQFVAQFGLAQSNTEFVNLLLQDTEFNDYYTVSESFTNNRELVISGTMTTEASIRIFPSGNSPIVIMPAFNIGGGTSIKGSGSGGTGGSTHIFPDPAINELNFQCDNHDVKNIKIFDLQSFLYLNQNIAPSRFGTVDISFLKRGMYVLKLLLDNEQNMNMLFIKN